MSKISGKYRASFGLHIVSGMLRGGNLIISYASGIPAWGQLDYGYDNSVPYRSPKVLVKPGEPGYRQGKVTPKLMRFHEYAFPTTYVDTEHFFRARVTNPAGRTLVSPIYSVYVPEKMVIQSYAGKTGLKVQMIAPAGSVVKSPVPSTGLAAYKAEPDRTNEILIEGHIATQDVGDIQAPDSQTTTIGTNPTLTVE
jgi:hypothetical protein